MREEEEEVAVVDDAKAIADAARAAFLADLHSGQQEVSVADVKAKSFDVEQTVAASRKQIKNKKIKVLRAASSGSSAMSSRPLPSVYCASASPSASGFSYLHGHSLMSALQWTSRA